jgi:signal transduction histidine kinase
MRLRLVAAMVGVVALVFVVFGVPLFRLVEGVERDRYLTSLERDAYALAGHARDTLSPDAGAPIPSLEPYLVEHAGRPGVTAVVVNADGRAVAVNDASAVPGDDYGNRPEFADALGGATVTGERTSRTLGDRLVFVAVPVTKGDGVIGAVRISSTRTAVDREVRSRVFGIAVAGLLTLLAGLLVALLVAVGIARPLRRLIVSTERLSDGDFSARADDSRGPGEVRELSRSFNAMTGRVGLLLEGQRQFAGAVSHQLRTPLTALRLRIETAMRLAGNDGEIGTSLEASLRETDRMQEIVEQLLLLSRIESGTAPVVTVDVGAVVRERAEMWGPLAEEREVALTVAGEESVPCAAMAGAIEQILDNYIDNALSVSSPGSTITVAARRDEERVVVEVVDEGIGLDPVQRERAFDRFWRAPTSTDTTGSGLGLAIVRQLAVASGGSAELLEAPGGGVRAVAKFLAR